APCLGTSLSHVDARASAPTDERPKSCPIAGLLQSGFTLLHRTPPVPADPDRVAGGRDGALNRSPSRAARALPPARHRRLHGEGPAPRPLGPAPHPGSL